ncbi:hypothetical protein BJ165DRAFT_1402643 [Panaeolus papilionaceus]|nr:hypothetical protein BJ165DRAFT_1402643 [Panaeolus papilionaceus]
MPTTSMSANNLSGVEETLDNLRAQKFLDDARNLRALNQAAWPLPGEDALTKLLSYDHIISRILYSRHISSRVVGDQEHRRYQATLVRSMCELILLNNGAWVRQHFKYMQLSGMKLRSFLVIMIEFNVKYLAVTHPAFLGAYTKLHGMIMAVYNINALNYDPAMAATMMTIIADIRKNAST